MQSSWSSYSPSKQLESLRRQNHHHKLGHAKSDATVSIADGTTTAEPTQEGAESQTTMASHSQSPDISEILTPGGGGSYSAIHGQRSRQSRYGEEAREQQQQHADPNASSYVVASNEAHNRVLHERLTEAQVNTATLQGKLLAAQRRLEDTKKDNTAAVDDMRKDLLTKERTNIQLSREVLELKKERRRLKKISGEPLDREDDAWFGHDGDDADAFKHQEETIRRRQQEADTMARASGIVEKRREVMDTPRTVQLLRDKNAVSERHIRALNSTISEKDDIILGLEQRLIQADVEANKIKASTVDRQRYQELLTRNSGKPSFDGQLHLLREVGAEPRMPPPQGAAKTSSNPPSPRKQPPPPSGSRPASSSIKSSTSEQIPDRNRHEPRKAGDTTPLRLTNAAQTTRPYNSCDDCRVLRAELKKFDHMVADLQAVMSSEETAKKNMKKQVEVAQHRSDNLEMTVEKLMREKTALVEELAMAQYRAQEATKNRNFDHKTHATKLLELSNALADAERDKATMEARLSEVRGQLEIEKKLQVEVEGEMQRMRAHVAELEAASGKVVELKEQNKQYEKIVAQLRKEESKHESELRECRTRLLELEPLQDAVRVKEEQLIGLEKQLADLRGAEKERDLMNRELRNMETERSQLQDAFERSKKDHEQEIQQWKRTFVQCRMAKEELAVSCEAFKQEVESLRRIQHDTAMMAQTHASQLEAEVSAMGLSEADLSDVKHSLSVERDRSQTQLQRARDVQHFTPSASPERQEKSQPLYSERKNSTTPAYVASTGASSSMSPSKPFTTSSFLRR